MLIKSIDNNFVHQN